MLRLKLNHVSKKAYWDKLPVFFSDISLGLLQSRAGLSVNYVTCKYNNKKTGAVCIIIEIY